jgi:hypothetical protein
VKRRGLVRLTVFVVPNIARKSLADFLWLRQRVFLVREGARSDPGDAAKFSGTRKVRCQATSFAATGWSGMYRGLDWGGLSFGAGLRKHGLFFATGKPYTKASAVSFNTPY